MRKSLISLFILIITILGACGGEDEKNQKSPNISISYKTTFQGQILEMNSEILISNDTQIISSLFFL